MYWDAAEFTRKIVDAVRAYDKSAAESLCQEIIKCFDSGVPQYYSSEDRERGYIETVNRQGEKQRFQLLSIAIGVVLNIDGKITSMGMISKVSAELKKFAKRNEGSSYAIDRRIVSRKITG